MHSYLSGVLKFLVGRYILHQVCTVFCCQAPPNFGSGPGFRVLAGGPGSGGGEGGGGGSGEDSFPVNPGVAALWHPRAAAVATTTVKVVTGGGQFEERPAP